MLGRAVMFCQVEPLMRVHHINLVNLAGYCDERDHLALVYEFMENRDLKEHLSGKHKTDHQTICFWYNADNIYCLTQEKKAPHSWTGHVD